jgi:hypothetical protein
MPTTTDVVQGEYQPPAERVSPPGTPQRVLTSNVPSNASLWLRSFAVTGVAISAAWLLAAAPLWVVLLAISLLAAALAAGTGRTEAAPLVLGLIPATLLANSGLVPAATYFVPPASLGLGVVLWTIRWALLRRRLPPMPSRAFTAFAVLYLVAAAVATAFSIRPATSVPYLAAILIVVPVSLWLGPWLLSRSDLAESTLALIVIAGVAATLIGLVLSLTGPVLWFDRWLGAYLANELTFYAQPTGIILLRSAGPFLAPGGQALVLAPAILAALALRPRLAGRGRTLASLAVVVMVVGLLATFARVGWAAVIVGAALLALGPIRSRRVEVPSAVVSGVMALAFVGLWVNALGADYRPDLTELRNRAAIATPQGDGEAGEPVPEIPTPETPGGVQPDGQPPRFVTRGGSEMSGRLEIWSASIQAIADSPWVGYGPGTNAIAVEPYLQGESRRFVGLTSHNTWLRTWVELGIVGIVAFAGVAFTALLLAVRRIAARGRATWFQLGLVAMLLGLAVAQGFETLLLGGVGLPSFVWALVAGLLVIEERRGPTIEVDA